MVLFLVKKPAICLEIPGGFVETVRKLPSEPVARKKKKQTVLCYEKQITDIITIMYLSTCFIGR